MADGHQRVDVIATSGLNLIRARFFPPGLTSREKLLPMLSIKQLGIGRLDVFSISHIHRWVETGDRIPLLALTGPVVYLFPLSLFIPSISPDELLHHSVRIIDPSVWPTV